MHPHCTVVCAPCADFPSATPLACSALPDLSRVPHHPLFSVLKHQGKVGDCASTAPKSLCFEFFSHVNNCALLCSTPSSRHDVTWAWGHSVGICGTCPHPCPKSCPLQGRQTESLANAPQNICLPTIIGPIPPAHTLKNAPNQPNGDMHEQSSVQTTAGALTLIAPEVTPNDCQTPQSHAPQ